MVSNEQTDDLKPSIVKQIDYYFGDVNLQRDKFLQDELKKDHGWVPIDVLLTFNRLKQLTTDKSVIADAMKESELVDVSDDGEKLRRNPEIPIPANSLEFWQEVKTRTVYIKGFSPESTLDDIQQYLKPYGDVANIVMRKMKGSKVFKGSVFATFKDKEAAENFVKNEDAKMHNGQELIRMMQNDYWAKTVAETKERKNAEKALKQQKKVETVKKEEAARDGVHFLKGQVLHVSGLPTENVSYNLLKEFFGKFAPVAYVVHDMNSSEADLRFQAQDENAAIKAYEKIQEAMKESDGKLLFQNQEIQCKVLEGEEEEKYWAEFSKTKTAKENRVGHNRRNQKRRNPGGRDFKNKRTKFGSDDEDAGVEEDNKPETTEAVSES